MTKHRHEHVVQKLRNLIINRTYSEVGLTAAFALVAAVLFTGASIFSFQKSRIFASSAVATSAEVVELVKEQVKTETGESESAMVPVFQYRVDGSVFEHKVDASTHKMSVSYSVGDTTTIYYNPENPSEIRDVLKAESTSFAKAFAFVAGVLWLGFAGLLIFSIRLMRASHRESEMRLDGLPVSGGGTRIRTRCVFVALEATTERVQNARMIRLVCRWEHPETGAEHLLRSASFHPTMLPRLLELGMTVPCAVDFDAPEFHEVLWKEFSVKPGSSSVDGLANADAAVKIPILNTA